MISYAQNYEDVILERAFAGVSRGFYVDVGAWDPIIDSVTCHFYRRGWRGVNIEPLRVKHEALCRARRRDVNLQIAVGAEAGSAILYEVDGTGLSTLDGEIAVNHVKNNFVSRPSEVEVQTLNAVFEAYAPGEVHFLKVDCEGSEAQVLNAFDLSRFRPKIILVEATWPMTRDPSHNGFEPHIVANGYTMRYFDGLNRFYCADEYSELMAAFALPPNIFDNFRRYADLRAEAKLTRDIKTLQSKLENGRAMLKPQASKLLHPKGKLMSVDEQTIQQCYQLILGRNAEKEVVPYYVDLFKNNKLNTPRDLAQIIFQSQEFRDQINITKDSISASSPFYYYNTLFDGQDIMRRHAVRDLVASPGHLTNFLGVRIDPEIYPPLLKGREGEIEAVPIPSNWHADIAEWAAALRAVELSGDTFRVVELGCGWGCWMLNTGCAARSLGKKVHLIGIEGDKDHVAMAVKSMSVNNFTEDQFKIYHGIAANESGVALFPIADDAAIQWGSAPLLGVDPAARRAAVKTGKYIELPVVGIQKIANEVGAIDLLHIDIQGGEFDFVSSSMHALKQHVAYILIGTHSRQIEGRIMELMLAEGWRLEIERPAFFNMHNEGPQVSVDGVQGWRNLRMLPD